MKPDKPASKERIEHILAAIELIQSFTQNHYSSDSFSLDDQTYYACLYQYTIIGEAVVNIDPVILAKYEYPWRRVKSFRNYILHEYHAIDKRVVWETTRVILPGLKELMLKILKNEF